MLEEGLAGGAVEVGGPAEAGELRGEGSGYHRHSRVSLELLLRRSGRSSDGAENGGFRNLNEW